MGRHNKKSHGRTPPPNSVIQRAHKLLERGDFKEAIKGLKGLKPAEQTAESKRLLQMAYLGRAREFTARNAKDEAKGALSELRGFGNLTPDILRQIGELRLRLGEGAAVKQEAIFSAEDYAALEADLAITHPGEVRSAQPEVAQMAQDVLAALEDVEKGRDEEAQQRLRDIPRQSPFADWKLFIRGLSAHYRQQDAERLANWNRLSPGRAAHRIATRMSLAQGLTPPPEVEPTPSLVVEQARSALERSQGVSLVVERLQKLDRLLQDHEWTGMLRLLQTSKAVWDEADPQLGSRLTQVLLPVGLDNARSPTDWFNFCATLTPRSFDPHWNLATAMMYERAEGPQASSKHLLKYLHEIPQISGISAEDRTIVTALIYRHLGRQGVEAAVPGLRLMSDDSFPDIPPETMDYYRQAAETYPQLPNIYMEWAFNLDMAGRGDEANAVLRLMLEKLGASELPLRKLWNNASQAGENELCIEYGSRLRRLLPLDKQLAEALGSSYMAAARNRCLQGKLDAAREAVEQARQIGFAESRPLMYHTRLAMFELKLGNSAPLNNLLETVKANPITAPSWYSQLTAEAIRYDVATKRQGEVHKLFTQSLKDLEPSSQAAGELAASLKLYVWGETSYGKQKAHIKSAIAYLKKCEKVAWQCQHLLDAHDFLCSVVTKYLGQAKTLEKKYYALGARLFRTEGLFHLQSARVEMNWPQEKIDL